MSAKRTATAPASAKAYAVSWPIPPAAYTNISHDERHTRAFLLTPVTRATPLNDAFDAISPSPGEDHALLYLKRGKDIRSSFQLLLSVREWVLPVLHTVYGGAPGRGVWPEGRSERTTASHMSDGLLLCGTSLEPYYPSPPLRYAHAELWPLPAVVLQGRWKRGGVRCRDYDSRLDGRSVAEHFIELKHWTAGACHVSSLEYLSKAMMASGHRKSRWSQRYLWPPGKAPVCPCLTYLMHTCGLRLSQQRDDACKYQAPKLPSSFAPAVPSSEGLLVRTCFQTEYNTRVRGLAPCSYLHMHPAMLLKSGPFLIEQSMGAVSLITSSIVINRRHFRRSNSMRFLCLHGMGTNSQVWPLASINETSLRDSWHDRESAIVANSIGCWRSSKCRQVECFSHHVCYESRCWIKISDIRRWYWLAAIRYDLDDQHTYDFVKDFVPAPMTSGMSQECSFVFQLAIRILAETIRYRYWALRLCRWWIHSLHQRELVSELLHNFGGSRCLHSEGRPVWRCYDVLEGRRSRCLFVDPKAPEESQTAATLPSFQMCSILLRRRAQRSSERTELEDAADEFRSRWRDYSDFNSTYLRQEWPIVFVVWSCALSFM